MVISLSVGLKYTVKRGHGNSVTLDIGDEYDFDIRRFKLIKKFWTASSNFYSQACEKFKLESISITYSVYVKLFY